MYVYIYICIYLYSRLGFPRVTAGEMQMGGGMGSGGGSILPWETIPSGFSASGVGVPIFLTTVTARFAPTVKHKITGAHDNGPGT